ncbi:MAG: HypC/HybG/HupF family hydrogenase formation chaperone [Candidatus Micrarchaeia archaeon]
MCITKPSRVAEVSGKEATLEDGRRVKTAIDVRKGDYVLVGMGVVIEKINKKEYKKLLSY